MSKKKSKKSVAELEMDAYAKAEPDFHEDRVQLILSVIHRHTQELRKMAVKCISLEEEKNLRLYSGYVEAAAAFDILEEDLRKEGFSI